MKKLLAIFAMIVMILTLVACGNDTANEAESTVAETPVAEEKVVEEAEPEISAETVAVGNTITTPFAEMTISEAAIANNIKTEVKSGSITYISGPDEKADSDFVYIRGTLKNTSKSEINMVNIEGTVKIDGYSYKLEHLDVLESDGSTTYSIAPLKTYNYTLAAEVPNELIANASPCNVNFGFNENFASIISFDENTTHDYNYTMTITK